MLAGHVEGSLMPSFVRHRVMAMVRQQIPTIAGKPGLPPTLVSVRGRRIPATLTSVPVTSTLFLTVRYTARFRWMVARADDDGDSAGDQ